MLKYIKNHMTSIDGIEIYPLISLLMFFLFFILLFVYISRGGKKRFEEVSNYPLFDEDDRSVNNNKTKEG